MRCTPRRVPYVYQHKSIVIEMLQYYGSFDKGQPGVAQGVEVHSGRERSSTLRSTIGAGAGPGLGLGLGAGNIADGMESMGFQVGCQLGERYSKNRAAFEDTLDIVKFLCKDFWTEVFRKQIDNLKTNHRVSLKKQRVGSARGLGPRRNSSTIFALT